MRLSIAVVTVLLTTTVLVGFCCPVHAYTINTTESGKRIRWSVDTVGLQLDPALEKWLPPGDAYAAVEMGFEAWRGLPRVPDLVLQPGAPSASPGHHGKAPTNGVYLLESWPYERAKLAITVVTYEMTTGRLLDADVLVNGETKFALLDEHSQQQTTSYDIAAVLTHETGHLLGLGESAADSGATMWPYAMPGETKKRSLANDDEQGVMENYLSSPPASASGCGALTIAGKSHAGRSWLAFGVLALALRPLSGRLRRARSAALRLLPLCVLGLLFGFGEPLTLSPEALVSNGTRDERALAEALCSSPDEQVAMRAHQVLGQLLARAPRNAVALCLPQSAERMRALLGNAQPRDLRVGEAKQLQTLEVDGLLFTEYAVHGSDGRSTTLRVPGGTRGDIGQRLLDGELPPADGSQLAVVPQADGSQHWAYVAQGRLFGGHLGDGPAIEGAL